MQHVIDDARNPALPFATELRRLHGLARHLVGDPAVAEDLAQDAALAALRDGAAVRRGPWLAAVLRHGAWRWRRRERARRQVERRAARPEAVPDTADVVAAAALHRAVADAVMQLPEPYRTAVVLRFLRDLPLSEVAAATGVPGETARTRIKRGMDMLRARLDRAYGGRAAWAALLGATPIHTAPLFLGALLVQAKSKLVVGAAALILLTVGAAWWMSATAGAADPPPPPVAAAPLAQDPPEARDPTPADAERQPAAVPTTAEVAAAEEATGPGVLRGEVVALATGAAVAGAKVELSWCEGDAFHNLDLEFGRTPQPAGSAVTDDRGRFTFPVLPGRPHRLLVTASGFAAHHSDGRCGGGFARIGLAAAGTIEGVVRLGDAPMDAAPIRVVRVGTRVVLGTARTVADGSFRVGDLEPGSVFVQVQDPRYAEEWKKVEVAAGATHRVEIELSPGRTVAGRVVDADSGEPIAGAELSDSWTYKRLVTSDGDGRFRLTGVDQSRGELYARKDGYVCCSVSLADGGDDLDHAVPLRRGGTVVGRVVDGDGQPVATAYVAAAASFMLRQGIGHTDWLRGAVAADGTFRIAGLNPDHRYQLLLRAPGCGRRLYDLPARIGSGEQRDIGDLRLLPPALLLGRVVDDRGQPMPDAEVWVAGHNDDAGSALGAAAGKPLEVYQLRTQSTRSDESGWFAFGGLSGGTYDVGARSSGIEAERKAMALRDGESTELELVMVRGLAIAGTVRLIDGTLPPELGELRMSVAPRGGQDKPVKVEADGSFRAEGLLAGRHVLWAWRCPKGWSLQPLELDAGDEDVELRLAPAATIRGRVVDADGNGVATQVWVRSERPKVNFSPLHSTAADGTFTVEVPPAFLGTVNTHRSDGFRTVTVENVAAGATDVILRLD